jgi:hypothetical protein
MQHPPKRIVSRCTFYGHPWRVLAEITYYFMKMVKKQYKVLVVVYPEKSGFPVLLGRVGKES